ncbi:hypothetical protein GCM10007385_18220 [Tateyamaria omphalii]|uniref:surface lipoprotein assembly modifier n=1 Tax=Tateyamaria omphalii TaxID=299262 RepID=UPI0016721885|nr:surface lipoprotein assembly modifier [Tateyamaria omphalii]GGX50187.1 hypothetical protein GCM10007385_18220 [Tateyamaria omphalii]
MNRALVLSVAVVGAFYAQAPSTAQTVVKPDEARVLASRLINSGQPGAALSVLDALIERDGADAQSHILKAHALRAAGDYKEAHASAREGWKHADTPEFKYHAAIATAQALSKDNKKSRAQLWLRRAAHVAPNDHARARAIRDHSFVRKTNPWSVRFKFGISPSDNVNNAPRDNSVILGGLVFVDEAAVPLSGIEITSGVDLRYNFSIKAQSQNFASFEFDQKNVVLTEEDANIPAGVEDSDFAFTRAQASIGRDFQSGPNAPKHTVKLSFGRVWYGRDHLSDETTLRYRQSRVLQGKSRLIWHGSVGYADRQDSETRSGFTTGVGATWIKPLARGDYLSLNASLSRSEADSAFVTHTGLRVGASYTLGKPIMGATATFSASGVIRRYDDTLFGFDEARDDEGVTLSTSLLFKDFDTHGFAPKVSFTAERTNSNISRYETQNFGVSIGFQSLF